MCCCRMARACGACIHLLVSRQAQVCMLGGLLLRRLGRAELCCAADCARCQLCRTMLLPLQRRWLPCLPAARYVIGLSSCRTHSRMNMRVQPNSAEASASRCLQSTASSLHSAPTHPSCEVCLTHLTHMHHSMFFRAVLLAWAPSMSQPTSLPNSPSSSFSQEGQ